MKLKSFICPECGESTLSLKARLKLGNIKCVNCAAEFRVYKRNMSMRFLIAVAEHVALIGAVWFGFKTGNWWLILFLFAFIPLSALIFYLFGPVELIPRSALKKSPSR